MAREKKEKIVKPMTRKRRVIVFIRNFFIAVLSLIVLVIAAGLIYTWVMGKRAPVTTVQEPETSVVPEIKPVRPGENTPESASVQSLLSPVAPGDNTTVIIKTKPDSTCTISVEYNKIPSTDSGLKPKVADEFGSLSWTWTVEPSAPVGKWPVKVTCTYAEKSAVVIGDLQVAVPEE